MIPTGTNLPNTKIFDNLLKAACIVVLALYLYLTALANTDLAAGRFVLFMDERITFDGVKKILHPNGLLQFLNAVLDGGDQRYGRSLWNVIAIFSFIPEKFYGETGQIVAGRMLQFMLLVASLFIVSFGILKSWFFRFILFLCFFSIPSSEYYMTMPKPEPLQLFFIVVFLYFYIKEEGEFSGYWIFSGLAFGTKISILPALIVFSMVSLALWVRDLPFKNKRGDLPRAFTAFGIGLALAVPILIAPVISAVGAYFVSNFLSVKYRLSMKSDLAVKIIGFFFAMLAARSAVREWLSWTFFNTTHGADQASVNIFSWANYVAATWFNSNYLFSGIFSGLFFLYVIVNINVARKLFNSGLSLRYFAFPIVLIIAGSAMNFAVIIAVKRLWSFYLYTGTVLIIIGLIANVEANTFFVQKKECDYKLNMVRVAGFVIIGLMLIASFFYWVPNSLAGFSNHSQRTKSQEYKLQYSAYKEVAKFLEEYALKRDCCFKVIYSPALFPPENNSKFVISEFWGPYVEWEKAYEVVILSKASTESAKAVPKDSPEYKAYLLESNGYKNHVVDKVDNCKNSPCYQKVRELANGGEVLVLVANDDY